MNCEAGSVTFAMRPVFKTQDKAQADEQQRRYYWSLTPYERLALAVRLKLK